jgi:hypothetical protein
MLRARLRPRTRATGAGCWAAILVLACCPVRAGFAESAPAPRPSLDWERRIEEIDALLASAHFQTAAALARSSLEQLAATPVQPQRRTRQARLEVMAATAAVALGDGAGARDSLVRALRADPGLAFDATTTSPKLLELLPEARRRAGVTAAPR